MAFLIIDTLQAVGIAASVPVTVELTDGRGAPITGYVTASAQVIAFPTVVTTDENGHADIDLIPTADITPGGSCYTVRIAEKQFLIQKSSGTQTLLDAQITDVPDLTPTETNDLLDHIADPFNAHGASAISVIPNADLLGVNVQGALEELQTEILDHVDDTDSAHQASAVAVTPIPLLASDDVQGVLEEIQTEIVDTKVDLAAHIFDISDAHAATAVSFLPDGDIISGNVQDALVEVDEELHSHIDEIDDAHDATAISVMPFGTITSTNVQDALMEVYVESGGGGGGASMASDVMFTPDGTITSTNVQDALVELDGDIQAHILDSTDAHDASAISAVPFGTVVSDTVQEQLEEVYTLAVVSLDEASEISFAPAGDLTATDVQAAIEEVDAELHAHEADTTDAHDASAISFVPAGDLASTDVQAALVELDAEKADLDDPRIVRSDDAWTATKEPLGFPSATDNTIAVTNAGATYTFTNAPTGASFDVWAGTPGVKYTKSTPQTVSLAKVTGGVYVYYNASGVLTQSSVKWAWDTDAPVGFFYYSATAGGYFLIDERHGATMDNDTQQWLSEVAGSRLVSGMTLGSYTLAPSSPANADNQFSTTAGLIVDADMQYTLPAVAAGGGAGLYGIFYRTGTTEWTVAASSVPASIGTTFPRWNENVAGTWQLTEASNGDFMNMWLLAVPTPAPGLRSYVLLPGEAVFTNLAGALSENEFTSTLLSSFPFKEGVPAYRISLEIKTAYSGATGRFRIANVTELARRSISAAASAAVVDHAILENRDLADQHPASAIMNTPAGSIAALDVQSALNELDGDITAHVADTVDAHDASAISFVPYSTIAATTVQAAIQEVLDEATGGGGGGSAAGTTFAPAGDIVATNVQAAIEEVDTELHAHENDTVDAHDASAISFVPTGTVAASTAQAAIVEVATDAAADLAAHLTDTVDAHDASAISFVPTGTIAASDVQAAIAEVATDADTLYVPKVGSYAATSTDVLTSRVTGNANARFVLNTDGRHDWGDGTSSQDVFLERGGAQLLKVTQDFQVIRNLGVGVAPSSTAAIDLPSGTTTAAGGIRFRGDTNLYGSAADTLTTDDKFTSGNRIQAALSTTAGGFQQGASGPLWIAGTGSPETVVTAPVGSTFSRTDGSAGTTNYLKRTGTGNTGWVTVDQAASTTFSPTGTIAATDVQSAIAEVSGDIEAHLVDTVDAHDASAISFVPPAYMTATNAQTGIVEAAAGREIEYTQITTTFFPTATSDATAQTVIAGTARTYEAVPIIITFATPLALPVAAGGNSSIVITLWDGATDLGRIGQQLNPVTAGNMGGPLIAETRITPTAGSHTYTIKAWTAAGGSGQLVAGAGGAGNYMPAYLRITKA